MFYCGPYLAPPDRSYRPGTTWELPLADLDYQKSLAEKLFTPEEGEGFIRETKGCWDHDRADPLTPEEAHLESAAFPRSSSNTISATSTSTRAPR